MTLFDSKRLRVSGVLSVSGLWVGSGGKAVGLEAEATIKYVVCPNSLLVLIYVTWYVIKRYTSSSLLLIHLTDCLSYLISLVWVKKLHSEHAIRRTDLQRSRIRHEVLKLLRASDPLSIFRSFHISHPKQSGVPIESAIEKFDSYNSGRSRHFLIKQEFVTVSGSNSPRYGATNEIW